MTLKNTGSPILEKGLPFHFKPTYFAEKIVPWYQKNQFSYPWRQLWEKHQDPYHVWVSEIMLQQTVIKAVLPCYARFLKAFPTVKHLAKAKENEVRVQISGLGYYRRFRLLHQAAKDLVDASPKNKIVWPEDFESWKQLAGVGDYTAAAVSSISFNQAVPVVDGNVERVMCRLFDIRLAPNLPKLKKIFFSQLSEMICSKYPGDFNQGIMELGQQVCTPTSPSCDLCPVSRKCLSHKNKSQHLAPGPKLKKAFIETQMKLLIIKQKDRIYLPTRSDKAKFLKNTHGFLTFLKTESEIFEPDGSKAIKIKKNDEVIGSFKHSITNHKIKADVVITNASKHFYESQKKHFIKKENIEKELISSLDKKAWNIFLKNLQA